VSARRKGPCGNTNLVENFEAGIVSQQVEGGTISAPEKPEPRGDDGPVALVLALFLADTREHKSFCCLCTLEVIDVETVSLSVPRRIRIDVDTPEGIVELLLALGQKMVEHSLDTGDGCVLGDIFI
jgi:hypothetical protein